MLSWQTALVLLRYFSVLYSLKSIRFTEPPHSVQSVYLSLNLRIGLRINKWSTTVETVKIQERSANYTIALCT